MSEPLKPCVAAASACTSGSESWESISGRDSMEDRKAARAAAPGTGTSMRLGGGGGVFVQGIRDYCAKLSSTGVRSVEHNN